MIACDFPALSCQFHPEYEDDFVEDCIGVIADMGALYDLEVADAHYSLATPKDSVLFVDNVKPRLDRPSPDFVCGLSERGTYRMPCFC